jgi:hypothetical protein
MRYRFVENQKGTGAHYTPEMLSDFVAQQILDSCLNRSKSGKVRVLDPAVGAGELLCSVARELSKAGFTNVEISGFDTDGKAISSATTRISSTFPDIPLFLKCEDFLDVALKDYQDSGHPRLFEPTAVGFDIVVANPPYVRTQIMGAGRSQELARRFRLSGRVDLYYAFILAIVRVLKPGGIAGIIVSNRFLTIKSGCAVRRSLIEHFDILHIWDLGDTKLFEAAVLPAVLLVRRKTDNLSAPDPKGSFTSIYAVSGGSPERYATNVIAALNEKGVVKVETGDHFLVRHGRLEYGKNPGGVWRLGSRRSDSWLSTVDSHTFCTFGDIGKVRVGVKTTADKVFVRSDWDELPADERPELLRPVATHHIARRFKGLESDKPMKILYTHELRQGKRVAVDLREYPKTAKYLSHHRAILESRRYLIDGGRNWYEIWVPQDPEAWEKQKLIFRDIVEKPTFWIDAHGSVVNGDCYWLACDKPDQGDLLWLALAIGNSSFIEAFYDHRFNNKLYAGRRRFMTQYVEQFPLPHPEAPISRQIIEKTKELFSVIPSPESSRLEDELNHLVWQAFGFSQKSSSVKVFEVSC